MQPFHEKGQELLSVLLYEGVELRHVAPNRVQEFVRNHGRPTTALHDPEKIMDLPSETQLLHVQATPTSSVLIDDRGRRPEELRGWGRSLEVVREIAVVFFGQHGRQFVGRSGMRSAVEILVELRGREVHRRSDRFAGNRPRLWQRQKRQSEIRADRRSPIEHTGIEEKHSPEAGSWDSWSPGGATWSQPTEK